MIYFLSVSFGLIFGSFANVCIYRMPRGESIRFPASHCPFCSKPIRWHDNVPLLSYFKLKGRCHYCRKSISPQYPLVEFSMMLLFLAGALRFPDQVPQIFTFDILAFYLLTISVIDYHHKIIPDELSLSLLAVGLAGSYWNPYLAGHTLPAPLESFLAALVGGGMMLFLAWGGEKLFKTEALGGGDVKLVAAFGAILGWEGLMGALMVGSLLGALCGGALMLLKRKKARDTIPYGPFLCLGVLFTSFFPGWWSAFLFP